MYTKLKNRYRMKRKKTKYKMIRVTNKTHKIIKKYKRNKQSFNKLLFSIFNNKIKKRKVRL